MKQLEDQQNFIKQGFDRTRCLFDKNYPCTYYWAVRTMQECEGKDCDKQCCKSCKKICGYRCNASSSIKKVII